MSKVEVERFIHFFVVYFKSYLTMNPLNKYKNMLGNRDAQFVPVVTLYFSTKKKFPTTCSSIRKFCLFSFNDIYHTTYVDKTKFYCEY